MISSHLIEIRQFAHLLHENFEFHLAEFSISRRRDFHGNTRLMRLSDFVKDILLKLFNILTKSFFASLSASSTQAGRLGTAIRPR